MIRLLLSKDRACYNGVSGGCMDWAYWQDNFFLLITITVYALAVYNVLRVVHQDINPSTALAWILVNLAVPYLGVPLYFLLGENKLRVYVKRRKRSQLELGQLEDKEFDLRRYQHEMPGTTETINVFAKLFEEYGEVYQPLPCELKLLVNGDATFEEIFQAIKGARQYIFAQYYIIRSDRLGRELRDLLIAKAREGVAVYLLVDDLGSLGLGSAYLYELKRAGVHVAKFLPLSFPLNYQVNFRNHRKLVLVDGQVAFTGGLNVGIEYVGRRAVDFWRDTHVKVSGPLVLALQQVFLDDWYFAAKRGIKLEPLQVLQVEPARPKTDPADIPCTAQVIPFGPSDPIEIGVLLYVQVIQSAKKRLWIASPYFVPDTTLERMLELAVLRGVDVRLLIPRTADHRFVHWVTLSYARRLQSRGITVHLYERGFMHQKVALVDDQMAAIGTSNFDNRSLYWNFETTLLVHNEAFAASVRDMLMSDLRDSRLLISERQGWFRAFPQRLARLLAPLL